MTRKSVQVLAAIVVGLVLLLVVLRSNDRDFTGVSGRALLPDFTAVADDVTKVRIARPVGGEGVTIHRRDDHWVVSARDDYPADVSKLRLLVRALADAEIVEEKTSNPEQYHRLGVDDPESGGGGTKLIVSGEGFSYAVILGDTAQGDYRYARIDGEATGYLIDRDPELPESPGDWLVPEIIDISASRVRSAVITHADGETVTIGKADQEQTDFDTAGIPDGRELSYATVGNSIATALSTLELEDARAGVDAAPTTTVEYQTWDGLTIAVEVVADEDESWIAFSASAADEAATAQAEAADINARVAGWQYRIPDYKKNLFVRRWDDLLKAAE